MIIIWKIAVIEDMIFPYNFRVQQINFIFQEQNEAKIIYYVITFHRKNPNDQEINIQTMMLAL